MIYGLFDKRSPVVQTPRCRAANWGAIAPISLWLPVGAAHGRDAFRGHGPLLQVFVMSYFLFDESGFSRETLLRTRRVGLTPRRVRCAHHGLHGPSGARGLGGPAHPTRAREQALKRQVEVRGDRLQPGLQALFGQAALVVQVQGQADELAVDHRLGMAELVAFGRPGADHLGAALDDEVVEHDHRVEKLLGIADLVTQAVDGHGLAAEVDVLQLGQELLPAFVLAIGRQARQQTFAEGWRAEDEERVLGQALRRGAVDVQRVRHGVVVEALLDHFGDLAGLAGVATEEKSNPGHNSPLTACNESDIGLPAAAWARRAITLNSYSR